ncbi:unnamed protein product [Prunus brigantina]
MPPKFDPAQEINVYICIIRPLRKTELLWILESLRFEGDGLDNSDKTIIVLRINGKDTKVGVAKISPLGLSPKQIGEDNAKEAAKDWNGNIKLTVQQMQQ